MIIFLNLRDSHQQASSLEQSLRQKMPADMMEYIHTVAGVGKRLQSSIYNIDAIIIEVCSSSAIDELMAYKDELKNLSLVFVLDGITSDRQIAQLLQLYPRYMTFQPDDKTVLSVLKNRLKKISRGTSHNQQIGAGEYDLSAAGNF